MSRTTVINGRELPILPGDPISITFLPGSRYKGDEGTWRFWTIFKGSEWVAARWRGDDPGQRFRDLEGDPNGESEWALACVAEAMRVATREEVEIWLNVHPDEAPFATTYQVGPETGKVVKTATGYQLV